METVELHPAYVWDCDHCGTENFARAVALEMSPEEEKEMREEYGVEPDDTGEFLRMPETVMCRRCGLTFETARQGECET